MVETNTNEIYARITVLKPVELKYSIVAFNLPISYYNLKCIKKRTLLVGFQTFVFLLVIRITESQIITQHEDLIFFTLIL